MSKNIKLKEGTKFENGEEKYALGISLTINNNFSIKNEIRLINEEIANWSKGKKIESILEIVIAYTASAIYLSEIIINSKNLFNQKTGCMSKLINAKKKVIILEENGSILKSCEY